MGNSTIHQFVVVNQPVVNRGQVSELAALFDENGTQISFGGAQTVSEAELSLTFEEEGGFTKVQSTDAPSYYWTALVPGGDITTGPPSVWVENDPDNIISADGPLFGARLQGSGLWCLALNMSVAQVDNPNRGLNVWVGAAPLDWEGSWPKYFQRTYISLDEDFPPTTTLSFYAEEELNLYAGFSYLGSVDGYWTISDVVITTQRVS